MKRDLNHPRSVIITLIVLVLACANAFGKDDDAAKAESARRVNRLHDLYNYDQNDSLIAQAPLDLAFNREHHLWENYYETWMLLVNTHTFMGNMHTALREVQQMHSDATQRENNYGLALANYAMGNAYINMGYLDEAIGCYDQSIRLLRQVDLSPAVVSDIYSYYCDALNEKKEYGRMAEVTQQWSASIDHLMATTHADEDDSRVKVWRGYYFLACAQLYLGLDSLDKAEQSIDEADRRKDGSGEFLPMSVLYYRAGLYLKRKDYAQALALNTLRMKKSQGFDDKSSMALIYEQRAEILQGLGRYEEALSMYKDLRHLTDSIYKKETRTQINELNTLFRVGEHDMEQRLQRNRYAMYIAMVVALALAALVGLSVWTNRRLRRKNDELAVARDLAQESLRMKSDFIKNISHEIRTPLNILSGFTQVVTQMDIDLPREVRMEASEKIQENTQRIATLVNQLLALSDSSSKGRIERTETVGVNQICATAASNSGVVEDVRHHFVFDSELGDDVSIVTSETYAVQALSHLLDNARKFTPEGGDIRLVCRRQEKMVALAVEDTGCGVPADKADEIFGEFVQLDEYQEGVGIGLSVSRNLARQLGGDIVVDTSHTPGARFVMTLPL